ncbi:amylo-alpha-1,6-glucosidase [Cytobacillus sp.]|uniref:amylo-alpha-1,6-glucosidase n=1 Tax=Cytobacillus sp. TaxID=2675269 RepID=UPI003517D4F7
MDITKTPLSFYGSYMALAFQENGEALKTGLFLNSLRGKSRSHMNVLKLIPTVSGAPVDYEYIADYNQITIRLSGGEIFICFDSDSRIVIKGTGEKVGLLLDTQPVYNFEYNYLLGKKGSEYCIVNSYKNLTKFMIFCPRGSVSLNQDVYMDSRGSTKKAENQSAIEISPVAESGFLCVIEDLPTHGGKPAEREYSFGQSFENSRKAFQNYCSKLPEVPEKYRDTQINAAYINWSSVVKPEGYLKRDTMFVSNNYFLGTWSWDHCFNAIALADVDPQLAWDQMAVLFDYQDELGQIPGSLSDSTIRWNFAKPPVHGWTYAKMMEKMDFTTGQLETIYHQIENQVQFYLTYKDSNEDGIPEYHHGNDSGQDNSTVFRNANIIDSPDLTAFLIKDMDMLATVAEKLGKSEEKFFWEQESKRLTALFCSYFLVDDLPAARVMSTGEVIKSESFLPLMSLLIADKLPASARNKMVETITGCKYTTNWGIASEAVDSGLYQDDAYWRGAIWAPTTLILIDALERCGEKEAALSVSEKYCELVHLNGFAENFNALTGEGLRDPSFTWTASAFIYLAAKVQQARA